MEVLIKSSSKILRIDIEQLNNSISNALFIEFTKNSGKYNLLEVAEKFTKKISEEIIEDKEDIFN